MGHLPGTSGHVVTGKQILHEQHAGCQTGWISQTRRGSVGEPCRLARALGAKLPHTASREAPASVSTPQGRWGHRGPEGAARSLRSPGRSGHTGAGTLTSGPGAQVPPSAPGSGGAQVRLGRGSGRSPQHEVMAVDVRPVPGLPQVARVAHDGTAPAAPRLLLQQRVHVVGHHAEQLLEGVIQVVGLLLPLQRLWPKDRRQVGLAALPLAGTWRGVGAGRGSEGGRGSAPCPVTDE